MSACTRMSVFMRVMLMFGVAMLMVMVMIVTTAQVNIKLGPADLRLLRPGDMQVIAIHRQLFQFLLHPPRTPPPLTSRHESFPIVPTAHATRNPPRHEGVPPRCPLSPPAPPPPPPPANRSFRRKPPRWFPRASATASFQSSHIAPLRDGQYA